MYLQANTYINSFALPTEKKPIAKLIMCHNQWFPGTNKQPDLEELNSSENKWE